MTSAWAVIGETRGERLRRKHPFPFSALPNHSWVAPRLGQDSKESHWPRTGLKGARVSR